MRNANYFCFVTMTKKVYLGDLHANTLKVLWALQKNGIISLTEEQKKQFQTNYADNNVEEYTRLSH